MARNFSVWAYWRLRLEELTQGDPLPSEPAAIDAWRVRARDRLRELVGPWPARVEPNVEVLDETAADGFVRRRIVFDSERLMSVPANLLVPDGRAVPGAAVLAIHGHGLDKDSVTSGDAYGAQLARAGFVVLAPDLRTFGERADRLLPLPEGADDFVADVLGEHFRCDWPLVCAVMFGEQPLTQNLWDLRCALDVLAQHELVDPARLGCAGWSYGGTLSLLLAALDERVQAAVVSCFFSSWRAAHAVPWNMCGNQVLWGMLGSIEHADVAALVAPRALCCENAADDDLFPADVARAEWEKVRRVYEHLGVVDRAVLDVFPGDHAWNGRVAVEFLSRHLEGP